MTMLLKASRLCFTHPHADDAQPSLEHATFTLERGALTLVLGENGSGKTTLLRVLAGLYEPDDGILEWEGHSSLRPILALVPQDPDHYIIGSLVREDLLLAIAPDDREAQARALSLARDFGLEEHLDAPVQALSYGQKKKLCLCSALAAQPQLLLLDEPFAGLDYPAALFMRRALARNKEQGITQVLVTHDLDLSADLADSCMVLHRGRLIRQDVPEAVYPHLAAYGVRPPCWWFTGGSAPLWDAQNAE